ncbi:hypothetical protein Ancab_021386 [Ancistrocladus abbreviatus]
MSSRRCQKDTCKFPPSLSYSAFFCILIFLINVIFNLTFHFDSFKIIHEVFDDQHQNHVQQLDFDSNLTSQFDASRPGIIEESIFDHQNLVQLALDHASDPVARSHDHQTHLQLSRKDDQTHLVPSPPPLIHKKTRTLKVPNLKHMTTRARLFNHRVCEFFQVHVCKVQFFLIWISPATRFGRRELLALESLFKSNNEGCLVVLSATMDSRKGQRILEPLNDRGFRVISITPDFPFLFKGTPADSWFKELKRGKINPGEVPLAQNLSNLLRLAVLYKYGGIYLDTDFIVVKELSGLQNSIGAQSMDPRTGKWTRLNNAALIFDKGHPLLLKFIEEFVGSFNGNKWGYNGPYLVSRVVQRVAENRKGHYNFTILPPAAFYPVDWTRISGLFERPKNSAHKRWAKAKLAQLSGESYGVHLWNRQSSHLRIEEGCIIGGNGGTTAKDPDRNNRGAAAAMTFFHSGGEGLLVHQDHTGTRKVASDGRRKRGRGTFGQFGSKYERDLSHGVFGSVG